MAEQDPIIQGLTQLKQSTPQQPSNPFSTLGTTNDSNFLEGLTYDRNPDYIKAVNQGFWSSMGNSIAQTVGGVPLEIAEGIGYLGVGDLIDKITNTDKEFGNSFSSKMREWNDQLKQQGVPVYTTPESEGFNPTDYKWWATNLPSIASAVSLLIPAAGVTKGVGRIGKAIGGLNAAKKLGITTSALQTGEVVGMAALSRHMEGMMEGVEVYERLYDEAKSQGRNDEEATKIAGSGAVDTYNRNLPLIVSDLVQFGLAFKSFKNIGRIKSIEEAAKKSLASLPAAKILGQAALEAGEEGYQFVAGEEAERKAAITSKLEKDDYSTYSERLMKYVADGDFWTSAFFGALGGAAFEAVGSRMNNSAAAKQKIVDDVQKSTLEKATAVYKDDPIAFKKSTDIDIQKLIIAGLENGRVDKVESMLLDYANNNKEDQEITQRAVQGLDDLKYLEGIYTSIFKDPTKRALRNNQLIRFELANRAELRSNKRLSESLNDMQTEVLSNIAEERGLDSSYISLLKAETELAIIDNQFKNQSPAEKAVQDNKIKTLKGQINTLRDTIKTNNNITDQQIDEKISINKSVLDTITLPKVIYDLRIDQNNKDYDKLNTESGQNEIKKEIDKHKETQVDKAFIAIVNRITPQSTFEELRQLKQEADQLGKLQQFTQEYNNKLNSFRSAATKFSPTAPALSLQDRYKDNNLLLEYEANDILNIALTTGGIPENSDLSAESVAQLYQNNPVFAAKLNEYFAKADKTNSNITKDSVKKQPVKNNPQQADANNKEAVKEDQVQKPNKSAWNLQGIQFENNDVNKPATSNVAKKIDWEFLNTGKLPLDATLHFEYDFEDEWNKKKSTPNNINDLLKDSINYSGNKSFREEQLKLSNQNIILANYIKENGFKNYNEISKLLNNAGGSVAITVYLNKFTIQFNTLSGKEKPDIGIHSGARALWLSPNNEVSGDLVIDLNNIRAISQAEEIAITTGIIKNYLQNNTANTALFESVYYIDGNISNKTSQNRKVVGVLSSYNENANYETAEAKQQLKYIRSILYSQVQASGLNSGIITLDKTAKIKKIIGGRMWNTNSYHKPTEVLRDGEELVLGIGRVKKLGDNYQVILDTNGHPLGKEIVFSNGTPGAVYMLIKAPSGDVLPYKLFTHKVKEFSGMNNVIAATIMRIKEAKTDEQIKEVLNEISELADIKNVTYTNGIYNITTGSVLEEITQKVTEEELPNFSNELIAQIDVSKINKGDYNKQISDQGLISTDLNPLVNFHSTKVVINSPITEKVDTKIIVPASSIPDPSNTQAHVKVTPNKIKGITANPIVIKPNPKAKLAIETSSYTPMDLTKLKSWFSKNLPQVDVSVVDNLIEIHKNGGQKAWGVFWNSGIELYKGSPAGTEYHEAFHAVFDLFLTDKQKEEILNEASTLYGISRSYDIKIEEDLADDFARYVQQQEAFEGKLGYNIKNFFKKLYQFLKSIFTNDIDIESLFYRINNEFYKNKPLAKNSSNVRYKVQDDPYTRQRNIRTINYYFFEALNEFKRENKLENSSDLEAIKKIDPNPDQAIFKLYSNVYASFYATWEQLQEQGDKELVPTINELSNLMSEFINVDSGGNITGRGDYYMLALRDLARYGIKVIGNGVLSSAYDSSIDEKQFELDEEVDVIEGWQVKALELNGKDSLSYNVRKLIRQTIAYTKTENNEFVEDTDKFGFKKYINFDEVYNYLERNLAGIYNVDIMLTVMEDLKYNRPEIYGIIEKLDNDPVLKSQFFTNFAKAYIPYYQVQQNIKRNVVGGEQTEEIQFNIYNANRKNTFQLLVDDWYTNLITPSRNSMTDNDGKINKEKTKQYIKEFESIVSDVKKKREPTNENNSRISDIVSKFGIQISPESLQNEFKEKPVLDGNKWRYLKAFDNYNRYIDNIKTLLLAIDGGINPYKGEVTETTTALNVAKTVAFSNSELHQDSIINVEGKQVYSYTLPTFIHKKFQEIKTEEGRQQYLSNWWFKRNKWLNDLSDEKLKDQFEIVMLDGLKFDNEKTGVKFFDMTDKELDITDINMYWNNGSNSFAYYRLPILSDSPEAPYLRFKKYSEQEIVDGLYDLLLTEQERINIAKNTDIKIKNWNTGPENGLRFNFIPEFNEAGIDINNIEESKKFIGNWLNSKYNREEARLTEEEILTAAGNFNNSISDTAARTKGFLKEYFVNKVFANAMMVQLTSVDLAFYKNSDDFQKRNGQIFKFTKMIDINADWNGYKVNPTYNTFYLKDNEINSKELSKFVYDDLIKKGYNNDYARSIASLYDTVNQTDAQAYITIDRRKQIEVGLGIWNDQKEAAFKRIKSKKGTADDDILFSPMKPFYFSHEILGDLVIPVQNKNSEVVLLPNLANKHPKLKKLLEFMEKNNATAQFNSAVKAGEYGTISFENIEDATIHVLDNKYWGVQQEVPEHYIDTENLLGSQLKKLILGDIPNNAKFFNGTMSKEELVNNYQKLLTQNIIESYNEIANEFGDIKNIQKLLLEQVIERNLGEYFEHALEIVKDQEGNDVFNIPLFHPIHAKRFENILNSVIRNKVTKQKINGGSFVLMSNFGLSNNLKVVTNEKTGAVEYMEVMLPSWTKKYFPRNPKGEVDIQYIQDEAPDLLNLFGYRIPTEHKYSMKKLKVVGFTPDLMGGIAILPAEITKIAGEDFDIDKMYTMIPNYEVSNGKLYKVKYNLNNLGEIKSDEELYKEYLKTIFPNSKIKEIVYHGTEKRFDEFRKSDIGYYFAKNKAYARLVTTEKLPIGVEPEILEVLLDIRNPEEVPKDLREDYPISHETGEALLNPEFRYKEREIDAIIGTDFNSSAEVIVVGDSSKIYILGTAEDKKRFNKWKKENYKNQSKEARDNAIIDIIGEIWSHPSVSDQILIPGGFETLKDIAAQYRDKFLHTNDSPILPSQQMSYFTRNSNGSKLIGIAANHNTNHAILQYTDIELATPVSFHGVSEFKLNKQKAFDGKLISRNLSEFLAAFVDNAKEPVATDLNINEFTFNTAAMIVRLGYNLQTAMAFINQPVIREYSKRYFRNGANRAVENKIYQDLHTILSREIDKSEQNEALRTPQLVADVQNTQIVDLPKEFAKRQRSVLDHFKLYKESADALSELVRATRADVLGTSKTMAGNIHFMELVNRAKANEKLKNVDQLFKEDAYPLVKISTEYGINKPMNELLSKYFPYGSLAYSKLYDELALNKGNVLNENEINYVNNLSLNYITSGFKFFKESERDAFINRFPKYYIDNKDKPEFNQFELIRYLKYVPITPDNLLHRIEFSSGASIGNEQREIITRSWEAMLNSDNEEVRKFARNLVKYTYFTSGLTFTPNGFGHLVPTNYIDKLVDDEGLNFRDYLYKLLDETSVPTTFDPFIEQLYRHETNTKLLQRITAKEVTNKITNKGITTSFLISPELNIGNYVKMYNNGREYAYKLAGTSVTKDLVYNILEPLGFKNFVYEFNRYDTKDSVIKMNKLQNITDESFYKTVDTPTEEYNQLETSSTKPDNELNNTLKQYLTNLGIRIEYVNDFFLRLDNNAIAVANITDKLIKIAKYNENINTLPEEVGHFIEAYNRGNEWHSRLIELIDKTPIYQEVKSTYAYPEEIDYKREAVGKLIGEAIIKKYQENRPSTITDSIIRIIDRLWNNFIKLFKKADEIKFNIEINNILNKVAQNTLDFNVDGFNKVNIGGSFYQLDPNISKEQQILQDGIDSIYKKIKIYENRALKEFTEREQKVLKELENDLSKKLYKKGLYDYTLNAARELKKVAKRLEKINRNPTTTEEKRNTIKVLNNANNYVNGFKNTLKEINQSKIFSGTDRSDRIVEGFIAKVTAATEKLNQQYFEIGKPILADILKSFSSNPNLNISGALDILEKDITYTQRWLDALAETSDSILSIIDVVVKDAKQRARLKILDETKALIRLQKDLEKAGINSTNFMYERDFSGKLSGRIVQEYNYAEYDKQRKEFFNNNPKPQRSEFSNSTSYITALRLWKKKSAEWFSENNQPHPSKEKIMSDKREEFAKLYKSNTKLANQKYQEWLNSNLIDTGIIDQEGEIVYKYIKELSIPAEKYRSQQYTTIQSNAAMKSYYNSINELIQTKDNGSPSVYKLGTLAPQVRKDYYERLFIVDKDGKRSIKSIGGIAKETKTTLAEQVVRHENDNDFGLTDENNQPINFLPVYYTRKLANSNDLSLDMTSSMVSYLYSINDFGEMNKIIDILEFTKDVVGERKVLTGKIDPITMFNKDSEKGKPIAKKGTESLAYQRIVDYMNMQVYGRMKNDQGAWGQIDKAKLADTVNMYTSLNSLALNIYSSIANVTVGNANIRMEAMAGEFVSNKDLLQADKIYTIELPKILSETGQRLDSSKLGLWVEYMDVLQNYDRDFRNIDAGRTTVFSRLMKTSSLYFLNHAGEHYIQTRMSLALAYNTKVKDLLGNEMSLWDAFEVQGDKLVLKQGIKKIGTKGTGLFRENEDGQDLTQKDIIRFINRQNFINKRLHGIYNDVDKSAIQQGALGRLALMFRKFIKPGWNRRFAKLTYNEEGEIYTEGYYGTLGRFISNVFKEIKEGKFSITKNWGNLETWEKRNFFRLATEWAYIFGSVTLASVLTQLADDDEDNYMLNLAAYEAYRMYSELRFFTSFSEMWRIVKSPAPAVYQIDKLSRFLQVWNWGNEVQRGKYEGLNRFEVGMLELLPFAGTYTNFRTPEEQLRFYTNNGVSIF